MSATYGCQNATYALKCFKIDSNFHSICLEKWELFTIYDCFGACLHIYEKQIEFGYKP